MMNAYRDVVLLGLAMFAGEAVYAKWAHCWGPAQRIGINILLLFWLLAVACLWDMASHSLSRLMIAKKITVPVTITRLERRDFAEWVVEHGLSVRVDENSPGQYYYASLLSPTGKLLLSASGKTERESVARLIQSASNASPATLENSRGSVCTLLEGAELDVWRASMERESADRLAEWGMLGYKKHCALPVFDPCAVELLQEGK